MMFIQPNDSLASRRQKQIDEFTQNHNWQTVFTIWQQRLIDNAVSLELLFTPIPVHDPAMPYGRLPAVSWWPRESNYINQKELQRHLDHYPGTLGPIHGYQHLRQGEISTVEYLWLVQDDIEKIAAVFIAASLFTRIRSSRSPYPRDTWPPIHCVRVLDAWAYEAWQQDSPGICWHSSCTEVLPLLSQDYVCELNNLEDAICYLADEYAMILTKFAPIVVEFALERDPVIEAQLNVEYAAKRHHEEETIKQFEQEHVRRIQEESIRRQRHPESDKWDRISSEELQRLVWTKSMLQLKDDFGKSDVAIKKRCKKLGIPTPPRGFWAKVYSGKIPHPHGVPIENE